MPCDYCLCLDQIIKRIYLRCTVDARGPSRRRRRDTGHVHYTAFGGPQVRQAILQI